MIHLNVEAQLFIASHNLVPALDDMAGRRSNGEPR